MIKNIFLDIDDTLLDFRRAEANAIRKTFDEMGVEATEEMIERYSEVNLSQWKKLELGLITRERLLTERFELLYAELGLKLSSKKTQSLYEGYLSREAYFIDGAQELLDALYGSYRLFIASNGTARVQKGRIGITGIEKYFDGIFISERVGFDKPSKEYFDACFAQIPGFERGESIIVGDSLSSDIRGGINAGIKTCWYNPKGELCGEDTVPDFEIRSLSELPALLIRI